MQLNRKAVCILLTFSWTLFWSPKGQSMSIDLVVAQDGSGNYRTITDAINAAPNYNSRRYFIKIKKGFYLENIIIPEPKRYLTLVGEGIRNTIISGNMSYSAGFKTYKTATIGAYAQGFIAQDIAFENTAGPHMKQAAALTNEGSCTAFFRCRFSGYQDTLYMKRGIQFFRECEVFGTIDFIFGDARVVLQNCMIYARKPLHGQENTITAQGRETPNIRSGIIIQNCTITGAPDLQAANVKTYLGRPWKNFSRTVIMSSFLDNLIDPQGWLKWDNEGVDNVYYAEYKNRGPGANTSGRVKWARVINSYVEAAPFTVRNFIHGDKWLPSTGVPCFLDLL